MVTVLCCVERSCLFLWMDVWSLAGPSDRVSGEPLSEVMARGAGLWKRLAASLLNYSEVENIKKEKGDY